MTELRRLVRRVPFWSFSPGESKSRRGALELDETRLEEVVEAWVPVRLPFGGSGVLVWTNCD